MLATVIILESRVVLLFLRLLFFYLIELRRVRVGPEIKPAMRRNAGLGFQVRGATDLDDRTVFDLRVLFDEEPGPGIALACLIPVEDEPLLLLLIENIRALNG